MAGKKKPKTGICKWCGDRKKLLKGKLIMHFDNYGTCPGSGSKPL